MNGMSGHCCGHSPHHGHGVAGQSAGCCCHSGQGFRRFPNKEERLSILEEYLKALKAETKGVEEHIAELKEK